MDENKLAGSLISSKRFSDEIIRIKIFQNIKKKTGGEKVLVIKKNDTPFKFENPSETFKNKNTNFEEFESFFSIFNGIFQQNIKNNKFEIIDLDDIKIKEIGKFADIISSVDTIDPRFCIIWHYNPKIIIKLYFNEKMFFEGNLNDFEENILFKNANFSSQKFWSWFIMPFAIKDISNKIPKFGVETFKGYLKLTDEEVKYENLPVKLKKLISKNDLILRLERQESIIRGIA